MGRGGGGRSSQEIRSQAAEAQEMNLLLDTVTILDSALAPRDISARAKALILDTGNDLYISTVSLWEVAVKYSIGKLALPESPDRFLPKIREKLGAEILPLD